MREAVLDGGQISSREALHTALAEALPLPEWYGRNLDALMDCLTDLGEELTLRLTGRKALPMPCSGFSAGQRWKMPSFM